VVKDKITKLKRLLTVADELTNSGDEIPEAEEPDAEPSDDDSLLENEDCDPVMEAEGSVTYPEGGSPDPVKPHKVTESVQPKKKPATPAELARENARLRSLIAVRELCDSNGVKADAVLLEALAALPTEQKRLALLESHKAPHKAKTAPAFDPARPRRAGDDEPKTTEDFVGRLLSPAANGAGSGWDD